MYKVLIFFALIVLTACTNSSAPPDKRADTVNKVVNAAADSTAKEATFNFIDGCVESSRLTLGEQKAYSFCKCIFEQVKTKYPQADSTQMAMIDTAEVSRMAALCR